MNNTKKYDIFISYRTKDTRLIASNLHYMIKTEHPEWNVSYDHANLYGEWPIELMHRIDNCRNLVVVIGKQTFIYDSSDFDESTVDFYTNLACASLEEYKQRINELLLNNERIDFLRLELNRAFNNDITVIPIIIYKNRIFSIEDLSLPRDLMRLKTCQGGSYQNHQKNLSSLESLMSSIELNMDKMGKHISISTDKPKGDKFVDHLYPAVATPSVDKIIYKLRVNRTCKLYIDDEYIQDIAANKVVKIPLDAGEYFRKVVTIDNDAIFDETKIKLELASILDTITFDSNAVENKQPSQTNHNIECSSLQKIWEEIADEEFIVKGFKYTRAPELYGVQLMQIKESAREILIPKSVNYKYVDFPVTNIGDQAFRGCESITSITIPNNVVSIGDWAFDNCKSLQSVVIPNSVTTIGIGAFQNCNSLTNVVLPHYLKSIANGVFRHCCSLVSVSIPEGVTNIGVRAFYGCESLNSILIPNSVTSIGNYAFLGCVSLRTFILPKGLTSIGICTFSGCTSLTSLVVPNSVTTIGFGAFENCRSLNSITIPNSVKSLGDWILNGCTSLTSLTIPSSVTSIGDRAFLNCISLNNIIYDGTMQQWKKVSKGGGWKTNIAAKVIHCIDGNVLI